MTESMVERVAKGIEEAEFGYEMKLVSLIDGVSIYRLTYSDGEVLEFGYSGEVCEHVAEKKRCTQARAAIEAMREPTEAMVKAARQHHEGEAYLPHSLFNSMIDAALEEGK